MHKARITRVVASTPCIEVKAGRATTSLAPPNLAPAVAMGPVGRAVIQDTVVTRAAATLEVPEEEARGATVPGASTDPTPAVAIKAPRGAVIHDAVIELAQATLAKMA